MDYPFAQPAAPRFTHHLVTPDAARLVVGGLAELPVRW